MRLFACKRADAATTVQTLMQWFAAFDVALVWVSDRGSHFLIEVMGELATALRANIRFTPAKTPRANGIVEAVCKQGSARDQGGLCRHWVTTG
jgi:hypothetical protein